MTFITISQNAILKYPTSVHIWLAASYHWQPGPLQTGFLSKIPKRPLGIAGRFQSNRKASKKGA
jgi:hypothetical protein